MSKNERQTYLKATRLRYRRARMKVKVTILDEFCFVCYSKPLKPWPVLLLDQFHPSVLFSACCGVI